MVAQPKGDTGRLFVVEQAGKIVVLRNGKPLSTPFLDISRLVSCCGEQGLLGLAFAPDYSTSGRFYVDYTDVNGDTRVVEYRRSRSNSNVADASTARIVLAQPQPQANHNGGHIVFGPDQMLYIGLGDGGAGNDPHGPIGNGQNLDTLLGKILRIDPRQSGTNPYTVPASNPFVGKAGARPEIWAWGLRNPWRFSFDRKTGGLAVGDVGQNQIEEIDWSPAPQRGRGVNYGWRPFEGTRVNFPGETAVGAVPPVIQYSHGSDGCSVTGGYVIRDPRLTALAGRYLYGDFCSGKLWTANMRSGRLAAKVRGTLAFKVPLLASFGEGADGRIYLVSLGGRVSRLDPK
jgi:glucose/arabinose dehydrogenase